MHEIPKNPSSVFIETYGCQMNKYDSELIAGMLKAKGFQMVETEDQADIVLINTCSVRNHAEQRALGRASVLAGWKRGQPHRKLGVIGCMAQRMADDLLREKPFLDFVVGPDEYEKLPDLLENGHHGSQTLTHLDATVTYGDIDPARASGVCGWVSIARGCDNFCAYCIVPYTRGRERSRPADEIGREIERMADQEFREVTLLGQNVNSYQDKGVDFADLLKRVSAVDKMLRIRFMTSHPKDLTEKILETMAANDKICNHLHLPAQSGSDRMLQRMNRGYTRAHYMDLAAQARRIIPGIAVTSDIMVGFPGETESDFQDTVDLMETVRFDEAFTYRYSPREGTQAAEFKDQLDETERLGRLDAVIKVQRRITKEKKKAMLGVVIQVMPESESKKSPDEWMGRSGSNHVVVFPKDDARPGEPVWVRLNAYKGSTLRGRIVPTPSNSQ